MARRLIDISVPLQNDVPADPPGGHPAIQYIDHQQGLPRMLQFFEGLKAEDLPDGQGWAVEQVQLSTHNGTHLDAPWHFHPTMNRGERSWTIDEVPLEWCLQPGVKLDFRHLPDGYVATARDVENELKRIGHTLAPLEIVVVNTSAGAKYGRQDYVNSGCGMGYEATLYLLEHGRRVTGLCMSVSLSDQRVPAPRRFGNATSRAPHWGRANRRWSYGSRQSPAPACGIFFGPCHAPRRRRSEWSTQRARPNRELSGLFFAS